MSANYYPETIRICKEHARPTCNICLVRAWLMIDNGRLDLANALFANPIRL